MTLYFFPSGHLTTLFHGLNEKNVTSNNKSRLWEKGRSLLYTEGKERGHCNYSPPSSDVGVNPLPLQQNTHSLHSPSAHADITGILRLGLNSVLASCVMTKNSQLHSLLWQRRRDITLPLPGQYTLSH